MSILDQNFRMAPSPYCPCCGVEDTAGELHEKRCFFYAPQPQPWSCPKCYRDWPAGTHQAAARICDECGYAARSTRR